MFFLRIFYLKIYYIFFKKFKIYCIQTTINNSNQLTRNQLTVVNKTIFCIAVELKIYYF